MKCDPILSCIQRKEEMYAKKNTGKRQSGTFFMSFLKEFTAYSSE